MNRDFGLDLRELSGELHLLLHIIAMEVDRPNLSKRFLNDINWDHFLELAWHHRVYPVVYKKIKELKIEWVPQYITKELKIEFQRNTFQMLQLSGEMECLCKKLDENQISSLFLKGPVLAADLYGDLSLRTSSDLDLLVEMKDLEKAEKILVNMGYIKDDYILTVLNDWKWRHHHITFLHPKKKIKVEIHWRLNPGPSKQPSFQELWQRRRQSSITRYPVYYLGREDLFLFLVSHGARHGWSRLRWLLDIDLIIKQPINWNKLNFLLHKYQYFHVGGQAIALCSQLLKTSIPMEIKPLLNGSRQWKLAQDALFYIKQMVNLHNEPLPEDVAKYHKRHLFSLMSFQQKTLFILSLLYPYPKDAETLPLPRNLHFLYFPLRPMLCVWRKTRKHALQ